MLYPHALTPKSYASTKQNFLPYPAAKYDARLVPIGYRVAAEKKVSILGTEIQGQAISQVVHT